MTTISGKKTKMEDISSLFMVFPLFHIDFAILHEYKVIERIAFDQYKWTKSKTSLAEYFKWIGEDVQHVSGGFWTPVEEVFKINRRSLARLASSNGNDLKPKESKGFKNIKKIVVQHREKIRQEREAAERLQAEQTKLQKDFQDIQNHLKNAENGDIETLRATKEEIKKILF
jgi:hypothetical protein